MARKSSNRADYLTVSELGARVGKSTQSIYKKMHPDNSFWKYVQTFDGKRLIHKSALTEVYGIQVDDMTEELPPETPEAQLIRFLQAQIREKDEQIRRRDEQINNLMTTQAILNTRLVALMDKSVGAEQASEPSEPVAQTFTQEEPENASEPPENAEEQKPSFWARIISRFTR